MCGLFAAKTTMARPLRFSIFASVLFAACLFGPLADSSFAAKPAHEHKKSSHRSHVRRPRCKWCGPSLAPWAVPSNEPKDWGYYVGGGVPVLGQGRYVGEGTWGWDYVPWYSDVRLLWTHGRRYQDGGGQYESDRRNNPLRGFYRP